MLKAEHKRIVDELWARMNDVERAAIVGYLNGRAESLGGGVSGVAANAPTLHIFYATETGNSKAVAVQLEKQARAQGYKTKNTPIGKIKPADLAQLKDPVIFVASTHGEGDPPEMARKFFAALAESKDLRLSDLRYAILGLGDKSYKNFCMIGEILHAEFEKAGGKAFHAKTLLDVDYAQFVPGWISDVLGAAIKIAPVGGGATVAAAVKAVAMPETSRGYTRLEPLAGSIKDIVNLNDQGSLKETYHIELSFDESLAYAPGDSAGIILPAQADGEVPAPRLYSIASSPLLYPQEVHLTVARATYKKSDGSVGYGICSNFLAHKKPGDRLEFYIQRNQRFCLPESDDTDIIMIGPGTGIAPFRAFMQERAERGASGRNWLFFGDQRAHCDFLYQIEWQDWLDSGVLTRLDAAFSRDQKDKIYVQDRMRAQAKELFDWLEGGARLYVCGSKSPMSEDVDAALAGIIAAHGGKSHEAAQEYLEQMALDDRYVKDVY